MLPRTMKSTLHIAAALILTASAPTLHAQTLHAEDYHHYIQQFAADEHEASGQTPPD